MMNPKRDWDQFALLLIDVQGDFWSKSLRPNFPDFPGNIERLLALSRSEGLEVVHLRARFKADMSDWMLRYRLRKGIPCVEGTGGVERMPFASEEPGEAQANIRWIPLPRFAAIPARERQTVSAHRRIGHFGVCVPDHGFSRSTGIPDRGGGGLLRR